MTATQSGNEKISPWEPFPQFQIMFKTAHMSCPKSQVIIYHDQSVTGGSRLRGLDRESSSACWSLLALGATAPQGGTLYTLCTLAPNGEQRSVGSKRMVPRTGNGGIQQKHRQTLPPMEYPGAFSDQARPRFENPLLNIYYHHLYHGLCKAK